MAEYKSDYKFDRDSKDENKSSSSSLPNVEVAAITVDPG